METTGQSLEIPIDINVGLIGLGIVGTGVADYILNNGLFLKFSNELKNLMNYKMLLFL